MTTAQKLAMADAVTLCPFAGGYARCGLPAGATGDWFAAGEWAHDVFPSAILDGCDVDELTDLGA